MASKDIIHFDIKPDNLIFKYKDCPIAKNQLIIIDFGLSSYENDILKVKCGTPGFIAPEILDTEFEPSEIKVTSSVDIFSMGIIFYILVAGINPFQVSGSDNVLLKNMKCEIDFLIPALTKSHINVVKMIKSMCSKSPDTRINAKTALELPLFSGSDDINDLYIKGDYKVKYNRSEHLDPRLKDIMKNESHDRHSKRCSIKLPFSGSLKSFKDSDDDKYSARSPISSEGDDENMITTKSNKKPISRSNSTKPKSPYTEKSNTSKGSLKKPKKIDSVKKVSNFASSQMQSKGD